jgi:hypothetical protein
METIKAVTIHEPYATLMRYGIKTVETRTWATRHRGPLLVCASKSRTVMNGKPEVVKAAIEAIQEVDAGFDPDKGFSSGHAVAIVDVVDCVTLDGGPVEHREAELEFGNYDAGNVGWLTERMSSVDMAPFPVQGKQRLFDVEVPDGFLKNI